MASVLSFDHISWRGNGLNRPECVLANHAGDLFTADFRGGVAHLHSDGRQSLYLAPLVDGIALKPNGIALLHDGSFLLTHLGQDEGGVFQLERSGAIHPWLMKVDGIDLPPTNFVVEDFAGRFWITVSTRLKPRALGYRRGCSDGFIVRVDARGAAIVADGLGYTNEVAIDPSHKWLYVNETFGRRLSKFAILANGDLGPKQVVTEFGPGVFPDGMAFDENANLWVVSIVSNRLICVSPTGEQKVWLQDCEPEHLQWVEDAYQSDAMDRPHLDGIHSEKLKNISSIAFAGADRKTGVLGCLLGDSLATVPMPYPGLTPAHWNYA